MPGSRREFLLHLAGLAAAPSLAGCRAKPRVEKLEVPLADLPAQGRKVVYFNEVPVEVRPAAAGGWEALSLVCTHQGCTVKWSDPDRAFVCPCHGARFDAEGKVARGPARLPLSRVPARVEGEKLILG